MKAEEINKRVKDAATKIILDDMEQTKGVRINAVSVLKEATTNGFSYRIVIDAESVRIEKPST